MRFSAMGIKLSLVGFFLCLGMLHGQEDDPVLTGQAVWDASQNMMMVTLTAPKGWHHYADRGPEDFYYATDFDLSDLEAQGVRLASPQIEGGHLDQEAGVRLLDGSVSYFFKGEQGNPINQNFKVKYQLCNDEMCLLPSELTLSVKAGSFQAPAVEDRTDILGSADFDPTNKRLRLKLDIPKSWHTYRDPSQDPDYPVMPLRFNVDDLSQAGVAFGKASLPAGYKKEGSDLVLLKGEVEYSFEITQGDPRQKKILVDYQLCNQDSCLLPSQLEITVK